MGYRHVLAAALFCAAISSGQAQATDIVGFRSQKVTAPERGILLDVALWYPAKAGGQPLLVGDNGLFHGFPADADAPAADGRFPLIVISHGAGGNGRQFGWIASRLAAAGFIVAAPNHPGSTSGNASPREAVKLWNRPADVSAVLTALASRPNVDSTRIGVLGFSAGGYTALAVAGARVDVAALARFCDGAETGMSDCAYLKQGGVDLHKTDLTLAGRSNQDDRVGMIVAVDPGVVQALTEESLARISMPVSIINLGGPGAIPPGVLADRAAKAIPGASYVAVSDATHFTFLPECKAGAEKILKEEGEMDPLCQDGGDRSRRKIHEELAGMIVESFKRVLQP